MSQFELPQSSPCLTVLRINPYIRPKDTNQLAKSIVDLSTGDAQQENPISDKNPHAVELGRLGGLKGGKARAKALSAKERSDIAKKATQKRWGKKC